MRRVEWMFALFVELILDFQAGVIRLRRTNGFDDRGNPALHVPFTQFFRGHRTIAGIVIREARVPPNAGVEKVGQVLAFLIRAGLTLGPIGVRQFRVRVERIRGFVFTGVVIDAAGLFGWPTGAAALASEQG